MSKKSSVVVSLAGLEAFRVDMIVKGGASLSGVADRLVAFEEFGVGGVGQLNPPRRSRINPA